jgi:hypothetical protein
MFRETIEVLQPTSTLRYLKLAALLSVCSLASASILFERDLPISGINAVGASRSNIAPIQGSAGGTPFVLGDDFTLGSSGQNFLVSSLTVWIVGPCAIGTCTPADNDPSTQFSNITLFGGLDNNTGGPLALLTSIFSSTHVTYAGGLNYLSPNNGTTFFPLYQLTFSNLGLVIPGGQLYDFAVSGTGIGNNSFALHASNAANSGAVIESGTDGLVLLDEGNPLTVTFAVGGGQTGNGSIPNFTPDAADVNVIVNGTAIPEPGTIAFVGLGVLVLAAFRRRCA